MMVYKKLAIGGNTYEYLRFGKAGRPQLLFVPGFSMQPHEHERLFKSLEGAVDGASVKLVGVNYLRRQPITMGQVAESIAEIAETLYRNKDFYVAAHSTGATGAFCAASKGYISPEALALWSPVTSRSRTAAGLVKAGLKLGMDEVFTKDTVSFGFRHAAFLYDYFSHPSNSWAITKEIAHFDYWLTENELEIPARVVYARKDEFGFVPGKYDEKIIKGYFARPGLVIMETRKGLRHLWPRDNPDVAAEEVRKILKG